MDFKVVWNKNRSLKQNKHLLRRTYYSTKTNCFICLLCKESYCQYYYDINFDSVQTEQKSSRILERDSVENWHWQAAQVFSSNRKESNQLSFFDLDRTALEWNFFTAVCVICLFHRTWGGLRTRVHIWYNSRKTTDFHGLPWKGSFGQALTCTG